MPTMGTFVSDESFELDAPPDRVFPLLCPTREHEWIPTWRATIVHSVSGYAELDCVFTTNTAEGRRTWICSHYDPNRAIGYTSFSDSGHVMRLDIRLEAIGGNRTLVHWSRRFIACSPDGQTWVKSLAPEGAASATRGLAKLLAHFLETGTMLRA